MLRSALIALSLCVWMNAASAEVKESGETYFTVENTSQIPFGANAVWDELVHPERWWASSHTWSGDSKNLSLNLSPGGGWDEALPDGGFVRHMSVIYCQPGRTLKLSGTLGPLQDHALQGIMIFSLTEGGDGITTLTATYKVSGHFPGGLDKLAPAVNQVLSEQLKRLSDSVSKE